MQLDELLDDAKAGIFHVGDHDTVLRHAADLPASRQVAPKASTPACCAARGRAVPASAWSSPTARSRQLRSPRAALLRLATPVDSGAIDGRAIDLLFVPAGPAHCTRQHGMLLAELAERFSESDSRTGLRAATDADMLLARMRAWRTAPVTGTSDNALPSPSFPADPA